QPRKFVAQKGGQAPWQRRAPARRSPRRRSRRRPRSPRPRRSNFFPAAARGIAAARVVNLQLNRFGPRLQLGAPRQKEPFLATAEGFFFCLSVVCGPWESWGRIACVARLSSAAKNRGEPAVRPCEPLTRAAVW